MDKGKENHQFETGFLYIKE